MAVTPPPDRLEPKPPRKGRSVNGIYFDSTYQPTAAIGKPGYVYPKTGLKQPWQADPDYQNAIKGQTPIRSRTAQEIALSDYITAMEEARNKRVIGDDQTDAAKQAFNFMVTEPIKSMGRTLSGQNARTAFDPSGGFRPVSRLMALGEDALNIATAVPIVRGAKYLAKAPMRKLFTELSGVVGEGATRSSLAQQQAGLLEDAIKAEYAQIMSRREAAAQAGLAGRPKYPEWDEDLPEGIIRVFHTNPSGSKLPDQLFTTEESARLRNRRGGSGATNIYSGGLYGTRAGDVSATYGDDVASSGILSSSLPDYIGQSPDSLSQRPIVSRGWDDSDPLGNPMGMNAAETNAYIDKLRSEAYIRSMISPETPLEQALKFTKNGPGSINSILGLRGMRSVKALASIPEDGLSGAALSHLKNIKRFLEQGDTVATGPLLMEAGRLAGKLPVSTILNILPEDNVISLLNNINMPIVFRPQSPQRFNFKYPIVRQGENMTRTGIAGPNNPLYIYSPESAGAPIIRDSVYAGQLLEGELAWENARREYLRKKYPNDLAKQDDIGMNPFTHAMTGDIVRFEPRFRGELPGQNYYDLPYEGSFDKFTSIGGMPSFDLRSLTQDEANFLADKIMEWTSKTNPYVAENPTAQNIIESIRNLPNDPESTLTFYRLQNRLMDLFPESGPVVGSGRAPGWENEFTPKENMWNFLRDSGVSNVPHHGGMLTRSPNKHTAFVFNNPELLPPPNYIPPTTQRMNDLLADLARQQAIAFRAGRPAIPAATSNAGQFLSQIYGGYLGGQGFRQSPMYRQNIR